MKDDFYGWVDDNLFVWDGKSDVPKSVENVYIPDDVKVISDRAFEMCTSLKNIDGMRNVEQIGFSAFGGCRSLEKFTIPNKVTSLPDWAFEDCRDLKKIDGFEHVNKLGEGTFLFCDSLEKVTIPEGVVEIPDQSFGWCTHLKEVVIPDSVTKIDSSAFLGCEKLEKVIGMKNVDEFGKQVFKGCESLETISIPDKVTKLPSGTFSDCKKLKTVNGLNHVEDVVSDAFQNCNSLDLQNLLYEKYTSTPEEKMNTLPEGYKPPMDIFDYDRMRENYDRRQYNEITKAMGITKTKTSQAVGEEAKVETSSLRGRVGADKVSCIAEDIVSEFQGAFDGRLTAKQVQAKLMRSDKSDLGVLVGAHGEMLMIGSWDGSTAECVCMQPGMVTKIKYEPEEYSRSFMKNFDFLDEEDDKPTPQSNLLTNEMPKRQRKLPDFVEDSEDVDYEFNR